jgi:hypothetical protein
MRTISSALVFLTLVLPSAFAQQNAEAKATLSGRVICADTNGPARFAKVVLKSTTPNKSSGADLFSALASPPPGPPGSPAKPAPKVSPEDAAERNVQLTDSDRGVRDAALTAINHPQLHRSRSKSTVMVVATSTGWSSTR